MKNNLRIARLQSSEISPYISELAKLRITVFREFPYLYDGDMEYEKKYLQTYIDSPHSVLILAFDGEKIIGASTALPLKDADEHFKKIFIEKNYNIDEIFYFGESVLLKEYRGTGIGKQFFQHREAAAREYGNKIAVFCGVARPDHHPLKPTDWFPLDEFWKRMGFIKHPELTTTYVWKDINEKSESEKPMVFWIKNL